MQENTESEKTEGAEIPEEAETSSEKTPENSPTESSDSDSEFEEHEGEVLSPEKKKNSGCGFFILIFFLLASGSGYLYYTDKVPKTVVKSIEPLLNKLIPSPTKILPLPPAEKSVSEVEEQSPPHAIEEEMPIPEKEIATEIAPARSENQTEKHISGSKSVTGTEVLEPDNIANISGAYREVKEVKMVQEKKAEVPEELKETPVKESAPAVITPTEPIRDIEKPSEKFMEEPDQQKEKGRNKAVKAYLDFFEASLMKLGELVKTGFLKGKDFVLRFLNKN